MLVDASTRAAVAWTGPVAVLCACTLSICTQRIWRRVLGEVTCRWRLPYDLDGAAFSIWIPVYTLTYASALAQLLALAWPDVFVVLDFNTNLGTASTWVHCACWVIFFDGETPKALWAAGAILSGGAATGVAALFTSHAWFEERQLATVLTTAPLALLTGWLLNATVIAWGTARLANSSQGEREACKRPARRAEQSWNVYMQLVRAHYRDAAARAPKKLSWIPVGVAAGMSVLAFLLAEPILLVPTAWALGFQRSWPAPRYLFAMTLLLASGVLTLVRIFLWHV